MTSKSKNVASLLAIFLGSFGAHRFYLRSYGWGVLYLLFCWTLIPGILGIVEGIRYLLMDEEKFNAKYTQESTVTEDTPRISDDRDESAGTEPNMEISVNFEGFTGGSQVDNEEKQQQSTNAWIPPGEKTTINGYKIPDGMVYVGTELSSVEEYLGTDACLINPSLEVNTTKLDLTGARMSYWPSYSDIDPGCRATYLEWLANGRRDPDIDIGYVFLFFYGLERRVFFDAQHSSTARSEIPNLLNEVEELLEVYSEESSFQGYATGFLNAARARYDPDSLATVDQSRRREMPLGLQIKIGRQIVAGESITPNLAYEWFLQAPDTYSRTPAQRCKDEFKDLFFARYEQRFPDGLTIEPNKTPLTVSYRSASRSVPQQEDVEIDGLPDVSALSAPLQKLQELANDCCEELDSYSRYVGKSQDRDSLEALSYLPESILKGRQTDSLTEFLRTIENELGSSDIAETKLDLFLEQWPIESGTEVRKRDLRRLISLCEKLGFGIEPDVRFTTPSRGWGDPAVLYRLPPEASEEASTVTEAVRLIQKLAIIIVQANDEVSPEETRYLAENLGSFLELSESDRVRLDAHRRWLILDSPTLHGVRQRAEDLPDDQKTQIANFLTALACSDGNIDPKEIQELSKIYPMLGLDEEMVHTHLHQLQTLPDEADNEPVTIQKQDSSPDEYEIPDPEGSEVPQTTEFELDRERVNRTLEESQEVSDFLADIFEEDEEDDTQPESQQLEQQEPTSDSTHAATESLDEDHRQFLITLSQKQQWDRDEVEDVARDIGLFPGAAMEVVNDYAFELVETPVIEGTDEIIINQDVSSKILE